MHTKAALEFVFSRAKQAALFTVGIPVANPIGPGPNPYVYWKMMKKVSKSRWRIWWPTNFMSFTCRIPAIWLGAEIGQELFPWSSDAMYWGGLFGYAMLPPSIFGVRPFMFPHGIRGALHAPGAFFALTGILVATSAREWRNRTWTGPEWLHAAKEAWADVNVKRWLDSKTEGKFEDIKEHFRENRGWEMRWQALETEMILRYQREYQIMKKFETEEVNKLNEKKTKLEREKLLRKIITSPEVQADDAHRLQLRQLALKEVEDRRKRIEKWVPFAGAVRAWWSGLAASETRPAN